MKLDVGIMMLTSCALVKNVMCHYHGSYRCKDYHYLSQLKRRQAPPIVAPSNSFLLLGMIASSRHGEKEAK